MMNGYNIEWITSVEIQEIFNLGGKVIKIYEGVICKEDFQTPPFTKEIEILFNVKQKNKDEGNDIVEKLVKLLMNSLYGENLRTDITEEYK